MKRRAFLGFLGGAVASGPAAAKTAAQMTLADLSPGPTAYLSNSLGESAQAPDDGEWRVARATDRLKQILGMTDTARAMAKKRHYISALDPGIASLRSVTLHRKIEMSRAVDFERQQHNEKTYLEGFLARLWE